MTEIYDQKELTDWYMSPLPRGELTTKGDLSLGFRRQHNSLPVQTEAGDRAILCTGAGCPTKIPFVFTPDHIERVKEVMDEVREGYKEDSPAAERAALRKAVVEMEMIVLREKLRDISRAEHRAYSVEKHKDYYARLTQDCVDQATNGTSYLCILAAHGLIRHHRILHPGRINIMLFQPHYFTRIKEIGSGDIYRFDLYHRGRFGIPPYVARIS